MPLFYLVLGFIGIIVRFFEAAAQEAAEEYERQYSREREERRQQLEVERARDAIDAARQRSVPLPPAAPQIRVPAGPTRRFTLRIPLADNQIAVALRSVRAEATKANPYIAGVHFVSQPGGSIVDVTIEEASPGAVDPVVVEKMFARIDEALREGYKLP